MTPFSLLIKPVGPDCNLDCSYCFYKRTASILPDNPAAVMTDEVLASMTRKYLDYGFPQGVFGWQGGEPTLAGLDFFGKVVELQKRYAKPGTVIGNSLQTNGVLIDANWAKFLADLKFLIGLSLDGPEEIHDRYRRTIPGSGSWSAAMSAIERFRSAGAEFNILCLVTDANAERADEVWEFYMKNGLRYLQFIPCFEPEIPSSGFKPFSLRPGQWTDFLKRIFDLWYNGGNPGVSVRWFDSCLAHFAGRPVTDCEALGRCSSYLVVERSGDVYPCDFFVRPEWRIGNIMEDGFDILRRHPTILTFAALKADTSRACKGCGWFSLCAGGCTRFRMYGGRSARTLNYHCESTKNFFMYAGDRLKGLARKLI